MAKISYIILLLSLTSVSLAQTALMQTQLNSKQPRWSGFGSLGYSSNMYSGNGPSAEASGSAAFMANYRVQGNNLVRAFLSGYQEQTQGRETKVNDGYLGWVNNGFWRRGEILTIGQQIRGIFPSSKESRVRDEKIMGATVAPSLMFNLTPAGLTGVMLIYTPMATKNFHQSQQNKAFQNNTSISLNQSLALVWSITDSLYFQPAFVYGMGWSYGGVKRDDNYQFMSELGYTFLKSGLTLAAGLTNAGAIRNFENGNDQTIQLYNNKTASVYSSLTMVF